MNEEVDELGGRGDPGLNSFELLIDFGQLFAKIAVDLVTLE